MFCRCGPFLFSVSNKINVCLLPYLIILPNSYLIGNCWFNLCYSFGFDSFHIFFASLHFPSFIQLKPGGLWNKVDDIMIDMLCFEVVLSLLWGTLQFLARGTSRVCFVTLSSQQHRFDTGRCSGLPSWTLTTLPVIFFINYHPLNFDVVSRRRLKSKAI